MAPREGVLSIDTPVRLHHGGTLESLRIGWSLSGEAGQPVVLALGGISASRQVFDPAGGRNGWWHEIVGAGKALDTQRLAVLGMDYIGASGTSTAPAAGGSFPGISSYDQAEAIARVLDHLGIQKLAGIVGASYGGMVALAFGERHPQRVERLIVISAADQPHPMATAWRSVQRNIARLGLAHGCSTQALELARALAMSTYRSPEEFAARFRAPPRMEGDRPVFPVEEYLQARGRDYAARNRPESFICLSESIDLHQVNATRIPVRTEVVAVREDQLVPIADMRALTARLPDARLHEFSSLLGHDAFLKEAEQLRAVLSILYPGESP
ncbi:MAG: homoserine O-succinyltransferase [Proteobacteria bacterium]|jgi:homoserine O-acetyltransferase|nr:homoserine O-succinyltransferase [Pseudomonadota bacterium]MBK9253224.1 homoserine O-succinyltransferase [Pseudomonadota bacterium]